MKFILSAPFPFPQDIFSKFPSKSTFFKVSIACAADAVCAILHYEYLLYKSVALFTIVSNSLDITKRLY